jgi:DNA mismatch repair ATPase MutS
MYKHTHFDSVQYRPAYEGGGGAGEDAGTINGSLVQLLNRTKTKSGSRLLRQWLVHPLIDSSAICERQDAVQSLLANQDLLSTIREVRARASPTIRCRVKRQHALAFLT